MALSDRFYGFIYHYCLADVIAAWKHPYLGNCHQDLLDNINAMDRTLLHSNTAPIIQSSGTGKSRTVDEQAKLVFTIPFNLRADKDTSGM